MFKYQGRTVLVRVSTASMKHHDQNTMTKMQVGEEKLYLTYTSVLLFIAEGS